MSSANQAARDRAGVDFSEALAEQLRRTPWFLTSVVFHLFVLMLLQLFGSAQAPKAATDSVIQAFLPPDPPEELEPPPEPGEPPEVVPEEVATEEPVPVDAEVSDHDETPNEEEFEEAKGDDALAEKPFDGVSNGDQIGLAGGGGGGFGSRRGGDRARRRAGGPPPSVVDAGLEWLKNHQSPDGRWDCDGFMAQCDPKKGPACDGKGQATNDVGVTGLALLAFLGAGHTHSSGPFKETVRRGLQWLKSVQDSEGCFGERGYHFMYNHGIAALAMAEAYGMTSSASWKRSAQKGVDFVVAAQNPYKAWRYDVRSGENDVSVAGWMVMALKSAKLAELQVSDAPIRDAHEFVKEMTDEESGRTGYMKKGERPVRASGKIAAFPAEESESLTAVGMLVRIFAGEDPKDSAMLKAGAELLSKRLPIWEKNTGKIDMYYWYYGTLAMFQFGGPEWNAWNRKMLDAIVKTQRTDGNFKGSWDPEDAWGEDGGRVYSTAMMTLCLEVYYRYGRVFGTR